MANTFDGIAELYDLMVPWASRLTRETPFFKEFLGAEPMRVLDAACGTGRHAVLFRTLGHHVTASDQSSAVLSVAEKNARAAGVDITLIREDLALPDPSRKGECFDRITVLGNVLAQFRDYRELVVVLQGLRERLAPGGACLFQMVNFHAPAVRADRFSPLRTAIRDQEEILFQKFFDFLPDRVDLNLLIFIRAKGAWERRLESTTLRPWTVRELEKACAAAGFEHCTFYGDYGRTPYDEFQSRDIIGRVAVPPEAHGGS